MKIGSAQAVCLVAMMVLASSPLPAQGWDDKPWRVECLDPPNCNPADATYAEQLEDVSRWLEGLGFRQPVVFAHPADPNTRYAGVSRSQTVNAVDGQHLGIYDDGAVFLSPDHAPVNPNYPPVGGPVQPTPQEALRGLTPVHELFHAVQQRYIPLAEEYDWIGEGSAEAVLRSYADERGETVAMPTRTYQDPLHRPDSSEATYATWDFWLEVGGQIGSTAGIAYLDGVYSTLSGGQLSHNGLDAVDATLPGGLYRQFPQFIAGLDPAQMRPFPVWTGIGPSERLQVERLPMPVSEVAASATTVSVENSSGQAVAVELLLDPDSPDLHLVVNGVLMSGSATTSRNRYQAIIDPRQTVLYNAAVVNVATTASTSVRRTPDLVIILRRGPGNCSSVTTVPGGSGSPYIGDVAVLGDNPTGMAIDEILPEAGALADFAQRLLGSEAMEQMMAGMGADQREQMEEMMRQMYGDGETPGAMEDPDGEHMRQEALAELASMPTLTLQDVRFDEEGPSAQRGDSAVSALLHMANKFVLTAELRNTAHQHLLGGDSGPTQDYQVPVESVGIKGPGLGLASTKVDRCPVRDPVLTIFRECPRDLSAAPDAICGRLDAQVCDESGERFEVSARFGAGRTLEECLP